MFASANRHPLRLLVLTTIFSTVLLLIIGCEENKSPSTLDEMDFPQQLTSSGHEWEAYWSPNMEYIAFLTLKNTYDPTVAAVRFELWIMNYDGSDQRPLILINDLYEGLISVRSINWSKDSQSMLARIDTPGGGSEVWRVPVNGSMTRLSSSDQWTGQPVHSPDGIKIAYTIRGQMTPNGSPPSYLYVSDPDLSDQVLIDTGQIEDYVWNSNSSELIYRLYDWGSANHELWKSSISGNGKLQLSNTPVNETDPCCSPDGSLIAYSAGDSIYITPSDNFQINKIFDNGRIPKWVPNSNLLLITSEQTLDSESYWTESWIIDLEGNIIKKIAEGKYSSVSFSSNGEYFVYSVDGNLWIDKFTM
jgi:dipeptidyl aminopeptidase/acylaminoacyl peptidase